jgi:cytochrome c
MKSTIIASVLFMSVPIMAAADQTLLSKNACMTCHAVDRKLVGPSYQDIAKKYASHTQALSLLTAKVKKGGAGTWGPIPMPSHAHVPDADIEKMVKWILSQ